MIIADFFTFFIYKRELLVLKKYQRQSAPDG